MRGKIFDVIKNSEEYQTKTQRLSYYRDFNEIDDYVTWKRRERERNTKMQIYGI